MLGPKYPQQVLVRALLGIILYPDHLGMVGIPGTHVAIARVVNEPLAVAYLGLGHPWHPLERQLHAPETPGTKLRELLPRRRYVAVGALSDRGNGGGGAGGSGAVS